MVATLADAAHHQQMFDAAKAAILLTMFDDSCGQRLAYAGQPFQFLARRRVDVNERFAPGFDGRDGWRVLGQGALVAAGPNGARELCRDEQPTEKDKGWKAPAQNSRLPFTMAGISAGRDEFAKDAAEVCKMLEV